MLDADTAAVLVIDVQEKLAAAIYRREALMEGLRKLIRGTQVLGIPVWLTEQNPRGLGPTVPEVAELLPGEAALPKFAFSCLGDESIAAELAGSGRTQFLLCGMEAHVCVYQTAAGMVAAGYEVQVVADAVSSRTPENRQIGLDRARAAGAGITSVETALFELLRVAEGSRFKDILRIVK
jgi:nicotinamidase-related amidase